MIRYQIKDHSTLNKITGSTEKLNLFSKKGYEGTGIDKIASNVGISKSVIYYYFKNKKEILQTLMNNILQEFQEVKKNQDMDKYIVNAKNIDSKYVESLFDKLLIFLESRKNILKIILMQSIKESDFVPLINVIDQGIKDFDFPKAKISKNEVDELLVEEFFMVLLPLINYVVFKDKWANHFKLNKNTVRKNFIKSYNRYLNDAYLPSRKK